MSFQVATYNVLATAYLGRGDYSAVPAERLDPDRRAPALVRHVAALDADVLCLQEVEADVFAELRIGLEPLGYAVRYEWKGEASRTGAPRSTASERSPCGRPAGSSIATTRRGRAGTRASSRCSWPWSERAGSSGSPTPTSAGTGRARPVASRSATARRSS